MGKKIELFSSSYEFLLRNCNKIYCFIKACWNLFSKSHQQAKPSIFPCHMETTWELKTVLSCFAFWENMVGLSSHHLPHIFCCSLYTVSCSVCVCSEFSQILFFFFIVLIEMCMSRTVGTNEQTCAYLCTHMERNCSQLALPGTYFSNHHYYVQIFSNAVGCSLGFFLFFCVLIPVFK